MRSNYITEAITVSSCMVGGSVDAGEGSRHRSTAMLLEYDSAFHEHPVIRPPSVSGSLDLVSISLPVADLACVGNLLVSNRGDSGFRGPLRLAH